MLKLIGAVLAVALAGSAGAANWKDLRVDASSEAAFKQSMEVFNEELSPERRYVFQGALLDIWVRGTTDAKAKQTQYTVADFYLELDGLSYEQVVTLTDPSGELAKQRSREANRANSANSSPAPLWQGQYHASRETDIQMDHRSLDSGELMKTRDGGTVTHDGRPINDDARKANPR
jgi:hypothetical protein